MKNGSDMRAVIKNHFLKNGIQIHGGFPCNDGKCYYFDTEAGYYIAKWSINTYKAVNFIPGLEGKGSGFTINKDFIDSIDEKHPYMLFATNEDPEVIFGINFFGFASNCATHQQPGNGEWVYAIPKKSMGPWCFEVGMAPRRRNLEL